MALLHTLQDNLLSPIPLAFALGVIARLVKSELALPKDLYASLDAVLLPVGATLLLSTIGGARGEVRNPYR